MAKQLRHFNSYLVFTLNKQFNGTETDFEYIGVVKQKIIELLDYDNFTQYIQFKNNAKIDDAMKLINIEIQIEKHPMTNNIEVHIFIAFKHYATFKFDYIKLRDDLRKSLNIDKITLNQTTNRNINDNLQSHFQTK